MDIPASTHWSEYISPTEDARFHGYAEEIRDLVRERAAKTGDLGRAVHFKQHVGVKARLIVGDLPEALRVGPFAQPTIWPTYVRFSNSSHMRMPDFLPDVRGMALKLVGVPGPKLLPGLEDAVTQDFSFTHLPVLPLATPDDLMALLRAARGNPLMMMPRLLTALGPRKLFKLVRGVAAMPRLTSMATGRFYSDTPIRFGDLAAKLDLVPDAKGLKTYGWGPDALRQDLVVRLNAGPIRYTLRAQFFLDEATTPIEDASAFWPVPYVELARLEIPAQSVGSACGRAIDEYVESLSFNPWHCVPELRPLGAMNRARVYTYQASTNEREAAPEPDGSETC